MRVRLAYILMRIAAWLDPQGECIKPFAAAVDKAVKDLKRIKP